MLEHPLSVSVDPANGVSQPNLVSTVRTTIDLGEAARGRLISFPGSASEAPSSREPGQRQLPAPERFQEHDYSSDALEELDAETDVEELEDEALAETDALNFQAYQHENISEAFWISPLFVLEKTWHFATLSALTISLFLFRNGLEEVFHPHSWIEEAELLVIRVKLFMWACAALYWELHRRTIEVSLDGFRLEVTRGVWRRARASAHLLPHTTIHIVRDTWFDLFFHTSTLQLHLQNVANKEHVTLPCLPVAQAARLKSYLTQQIDRQISIREE